MSAGKGSILAQLMARLPDWNSPSLHEIHSRLLSGIMACRFTCLNQGLTNLRLSFLASK